MFARILRIIDDFLPNTITKDIISVTDRKKFIKERFMNIKNKIVFIANKTIRKHINDAEKIHIVHNFKQVT
jgi:hypothetical protein